MLLKFYLTRQQKTRLSSKYEEKDVKVIIDVVSFSNYEHKDTIYSTLPNTGFYKNNVLYNFGILLPVLWVFIIFRTNGSQKACIQTFKFICMTFIGEALYNIYGTLCLVFFSPIVKYKHTGIQLTIGYASMP